MFSNDELERYARHIVLKELGGPGQQRLKAAHVALIGLGGLGGPAALYLAAAGVGRLTVIDPDQVSLSNLQRQILFATADVGRAKPQAGAQALTALNPDIRVDPIAQAISAENAERLLVGVDLVVDGCDDFPTRLAVNAACHRLGLPLVSGAIERWDGQVGLFASGLDRDRPPATRRPCYQCLVPAPPPDAETCAQAGVVGALGGLIGAAMALEAVKWLAGAGETLDARLWLFDGLSFEARTVRLARDPACAVCGD